MHSMVTLTGPCIHEVKCAVRGDEGDGAVVFKARKAHALMKLHVLQVDRLLPPCAALILKQHLGRCGGFLSHLVDATAGGHDSWRLSSRTKPKCTQDNRSP